LYQIVILLIDLRLKVVYLRAALLFLAEIDVIEKRFSAAEVWNCNKKLGQSVAKRAFDRAIELAEQHGIGMVSVDNCFHYLWGGGYVIEAAKRGYIAYTNCTSTLAEVVPFGGKTPTLGTNPHSWGFPTTDALGYPICIDWATSTVAMGRVQQLKREGKEIPPLAAVDADGKPTTEFLDQATKIVCFQASSKLKQRKSPRSLVVCSSVMRSLLN